MFFLAGKNYLENSLFRDVTTVLNERKHLEMMVRSFPDYVSALNTLAANRYTIYVMGKLLTCTFNVGFSILIPAMHNSCTQILCFADFLQT
jgi:hypothetical protein